MGSKSGILLSFMQFYMQMTFKSFNFEVMKLMLRPINKGIGRVAQLDRASAF